MTSRRRSTGTSHPHRSGAAASVVGSWRAGVGVRRHCVPVRSARRRRRASPAMPSGRQDHRGRQGDTGAQADDAGAHVRRQLRPPPNDSVERTTIPPPSTAPGIAADAGDQREREQRDRAGEVEGRLVGGAGQRREQRPGEPGDEAATGRSHAASARSVENPTAEVATSDPRIAVRAVPLRPRRIAATKAATATKATTTRTSEPARPGDPGHDLVGEARAWDGARRTRCPPAGVTEKRRSGRR